MTKKKLIEFTNEIAEIYESGKIHAPIHLGGDNEDQLIEIFKDYNKGDWILSTWRNSYHWLLSGRSVKELKKQIVEGYSMHVYGDKFFTSAIVGGIAPIAVGLAWALKLKHSNEKVWCFLGDGAYACGIVKESIVYAEGHDLPVKFVIEDNNLTVQANTKKIWGVNRVPKVIKYDYKRKYPHAGNGKYVMF